MNLIWNEGIAFGLLSFNQSYFYNILTILIAVIIIIIFFMLLKSDGFRKYSFLMIFGGALGNLYDRIFFKAVPDFVDFHIGNFHWFIFNVADIFISIGIICLIFDEMFFNKNNNEKISSRLLTFLILICFFLTSCQSIKDGLSGRKSENSDEFLVQKKTL